MGIHIHQRIFDGGFELRIGIDVGGTFTDIVLVDDRTSEIYYTKTATTPGDLSEGVVTGIKKILKMTGGKFADVDHIVHGTTIGTNALIEKQGARTGLITTEGFIDVLEIGRIQRPKEGLYDFYVSNPQPLIPRYLRKGVSERTSSEGRVITKLDEDSVIEVIKYFKKEKVESIAVSLLFSFLNPRHEQRIKKLIEKHYPKAYISLSSDVAPEFREFERTSTTVINAYLQPIIDRYLTVLQRKLSKMGKFDLRIMQAGGGIITAEAARTNAVALVNSGPAGGAIAASYIGSLVGNKQLITVDMGGTSFDISLVDKGMATVTTEGYFEGFPVKIPVIDVNTIGAGGGSIAWIDKGDILNVGPQSSGAMPGPACYNFGGKEPTVTDSNLMLGRLNPDYFLGGEMKLKPNLAKKAVKTHISAKIDMDEEDAANGVLKVVNANMVKGISVNSTEKGYDHRDFTLVAFGGAGPLHSVQLAYEIGIPNVIIPPYAGALSALGLQVADTKYDYVQSFFIRDDNLKPETLLKNFNGLERKSMIQLKQEGIKEKDMELIWSADMRYLGQSYELNIPVKRKSKFGQADMAKVLKDFHVRHQSVYEYSSPAESIEFVNLRVTGIGRTPKMKMKFSGHAYREMGLNPKNITPQKALKHAAKQEREVFFDNSGFIPTQIYERDLLVPGCKFKGPALIEEIISTTVMIPGSKGEVDKYGNIIIQVDSGRGGGR
jgi:N-methylhydantoinase A